MLDATIAISSYVPAPGSAKKVTSVKKVASVKKATKDEKPKVSSTSARVHDSRASCDLLFAHLTSGVPL